MSDYISTSNSDSLRRFFVKVNSDAVVRVHFLANPVKVLAAEGLTLSTKAKKEVLILTELLLRKLPDMAALPKGYEVEVLEDIAKSLDSQESELKSKKRYEDDPMMF